MGIVKYYLNGTGFDSYNVFVSNSDGLLGVPALQTAYAQQWFDYHGAIPYAQKKYYTTRAIRLQCFIYATSRQDFVTKVQTFVRAWNTNRATGYSRTDRLMVDITPDTAEPAKKMIAYEVMLNSAAEVSKVWHENQNIGTFTLNLTEYEPCKRILCHVVTTPVSDVASLTITTTKLLNIYWGDGAATFDVSGTSQTVTHSYSAAGTYYIIIAGCIDEISAFTINSSTSVKWNRLP